jgi:hypothetical protein
MGQVENELLGTPGVLAMVGNLGTVKALASRFIEDFNVKALHPQGRCHYTVNVACTARRRWRWNGRATGPGFTVEGFLNAPASDQLRLQGEEPTLPRQAAAGELKLIFFPNSSF